MYSMAAFPLPPKADFTLNASISDGFRLPGHIHRASETERRTGDARSLTHGSSLALFVGYSRGLSVVLSPNQATGKRDAPGCTLLS